MKTLTIVLIVLSSIVLSSCKKDVQNYQSEGLLANPGFEVQGQQSFNGWTGRNYSFEQNTSFQNGKWSLLLYPGDFYNTPAGLAETFITNHPGSFIANLTCNTKTSEMLGYVSLFVQKQNSDLIQLSSTTFNNDEWNTVSLSTPVTLSRTDKLIVRLEAGYEEVFREGQTVLFDNVILELQY
jgi:hypothetical protein